MAAALLLAALTCTAWAAEETCVVEFREDLYQGVEIALMEEDQDDRELYDLLLEQICARETDIDVSGFQVDPDRVFYYYNQVMKEHPELFYVDSIQCRYSKYATTVEVRYLPFSAGEIEDFHRLVDEIVATADGMTAVETVLAFHDYLVINCAYDREVYENGYTADPMVYRSYGALVNQDAVCEGYAKALQLLLNEAGLENCLVTSSAMNHAWNAVELDGAWYHVDTTWDDQVLDHAGQCLHRYMLRSDTWMKEKGDHTTWSMSVPACESDRYDTGWIFNGTDHPIYHWDGHYYFIDTNGAMWKSQGLEAGAEETVNSDLRMAFYSGVLWDDEELLYLSVTRPISPGSVELCAFSRCDLATGLSRPIAPFSFGRQWMGDLTGDYLGIRLDEERMELAAVSSETEETAGRAALFPVDWELPTSGTALVGIDGDRAGLYWARDTAAELYVGWYAGGKLLDARWSTVEPAAGCQWAALPASPAQSRATQIKLFLLEPDGSLRPVGQSLEAETGRSLYLCRYLGSEAAGMNWSPASMSIAWTTGAAISWRPRPAGHTPG